MEVVKGGKATEEAGRVVEAEMAQVTEALAEVAAKVRVLWVGTLGEAVTVEVDLVVDLKVEAMVEAMAVAEAVSTVGMEAGLVEMVKAGSLAWEDMEVKEVQAAVKVVSEVAVDGHK